MTDHLQHRPFKTWTEENFENRRKMTEQKEQLIGRVQKIFDGDRERALFWWRTKNPRFGHLAPDFVWRMGRGHKLEQFIMDAENGDSA